MYELKTELNTAINRASRKAMKAILKQGREPYADEVRDAILCDEEFMDTLKDFAKRDIELRELQVREELAEEHESKTADSMRKRHVPEWRIDKQNMTLKRV